MNTLGRILRIVLQSGNRKLSAPEILSWNITPLIRKRYSQDSREKLGFRSTFSQSDDSNPHLRSILLNNRKWVEETKKKDPEYFVKLSAVHNPKYLYIGCCDSRIPAIQILGLRY